MNMNMITVAYCVASMWHFVRSYNLMQEVDTTYGKCASVTEPPYFSVDSPVGSAELLALVR